MGANKLSATPGLAGYSHGEAPLTADVSAAETDTELVFFASDPEGSYTRFREESFGLAAGPKETAVGYVHRGGEKIYYFGTGLQLVNGNVPQSLAAVYQRDHGECEREVPWRDVLDAVVAEVKAEERGHERVPWCEILEIKGVKPPGCESLGTNREDFTKYVTGAVAGSYVRREGTWGQAGFGLFLEGGVAFDSWYLPYVRFAGRAAFDMVLGRGSGEEGDGPVGVPRIRMVGAPGVASECPGADLGCQRKKVETAFADAIEEQVVGEMNETLLECLWAEVDTALLCSDAVPCHSTLEAVGLSLQARDEALDRGAESGAAESLRAILVDPASWRCAPVKESCASVLGVNPTPENVCQLRLQATDVIAMPESFSLVWHASGAGREPVTTGQALYLALSALGDASRLDQLCSDVSTTNLDHRFVEREK